MERSKGMVYSGPGGAAVFEMELDTQIGFPVGPCGRTKGNRQMLKHKKFCPNMRKHFFALRVFRPQSRLPRGRGVPILGDIQNPDGWDHA